MPAPVILVEASPRRAADGVVQTVRLAGGGAEVPYRYGGVDWRAGINELPQSLVALVFEGEQLGGGGTAQALEIGWAPATNAGLAELAGLYWPDAPVKVRIGPEDSTLTMPPIVASGLVLDVAVESGRLRIALADAAVDLKRSLLKDRFGGTGGADGPVEWKGKIRSRGWGRLFNVAGDCIDKANNIWCFADPTRAWQSFDAVRDQGVPAAGATLTTLAWQGSVAATFTALQAAIAPAGGGVRCPSIACVKWWTTPAGDLHVDARGETAGGYVETAPEIAARIVAAVSTLTFASGAVAAAASARSAPCGWLVTSDVAQATDELSALLGGVSLSWTIVAGLMEFRAWDWTASTRSARSEGVTRRSVRKPVSARKVGYHQNQAPMGRGELAGVVFLESIIAADGTLLSDVIADTVGQDGAPGAAGAGAFTILPVHDDGSIAIAGGSVTCVNGDSDPAFYVQELKQGGCEVTFKAGPTFPYFFVGLHDPAIAVTNTGASHLHYAWHITPSGNANDLQIYEGDGGAGNFDYRGSFGQLTGARICSIRYDNRDVTYLLDGVPARTVPDVGSGLTWRVKGVLLTDGSTVADMTWSAAGAAGTDGISPPLITIAATPSTARYDAADAYVPQDVTFSTSRQNTTDAPVFRLFGLDGAEIYHNTAAGYVSAFPTQYTSSGPDNLVMLSAIVTYLVGTYGGGITMQAEAGGHVHRATVRKVKDGAAGTAAPLVQTQWSANGSTGWHSTYAAGDLYQRQSNDNGTMWSAAVRVVGEEGSPGPDGVSPSQVFKRSATVPSPPTDNTGNPPTGWSDGPPAGTDFIWQSSAKFLGATQLTSWTAPQRISGADGAPGASSITQGSVDGSSGWHSPPTSGDRYLRVSNNNGTTFGAAFQVAGEEGDPGTNGQYQQHVFKRATSAPAAPSGNGIPSGWSDGIPTGTDPLYMTVSTQRDGVLVSGATWSTPARLDGAKGDTGASASPAYPAASITGRGTWPYPSIIPLDDGQLVGFEAKIYAYNPPAGSEPTPGNVTVQLQYSTDGGSSWNVMNSSTQGVANGVAKFVGVTGSITNSSGAQQLVNLRVVISTGGTGGDSIDLSSGYEQPS